MSACNQLSGRLRCRVHLPRPAQPDSDQPQPDADDFTAEERAAMKERAKEKKAFLVRSGRAGAGGMAWVFGRFERPDLDPAKK